MHFSHVPDTATPNAMSSPPMLWPAAGRAPNAPAVSPAEWATHRELIKRLYLEQNKKLDHVMDYMKQQHGFCPSYVEGVAFTPLPVSLEIYLPLDDSKRQYTLQLGHWNYFKKQSRRRRQHIDNDGASQVSEPSLCVPSQSHSSERDIHTVACGEGRDEHRGPSSAV